MLDSGPRITDDALRMRIRESNIIITGASSGIGRATALALAQSGANLVLAARRAAELERVAEECRRTGVRCAVVPTDVSRQDACESLIRTATAELGPIDGLINNAGFAIFDRLETALLDDIRSMIETNFLGAVYCTRTVLPGMLERKRGAIVNVASISGLMGYESMGGYCASKFAMVGFTEALRNELMGRGVEVSLICPGTTDTPFFVTAEKGKIPGASRLILAMSPEKVAAAIISAIERPVYRKIMPFTAAAFLRLKELSPRLAHLLMRRVSSFMPEKNR